MQSSRTIVRPGRQLWDALKCDLCSDLLKEATTATECCHTFCRSCIDGAICIGGSRNICPVCGDDTILGPNPYVYRKLEYDTALDDLVRQIFPRPDDAARLKERQEREAEVRQLRAEAGLPARVHNNFRRPLSLEESLRAPQWGSGTKRKSFASLNGSPSGVQKPRKFGTHSVLKPRFGKRTETAVATQLILVKPGADPTGDTPDTVSALWRPYINLPRMVTAATLLKYISLVTELPLEQLELVCMGKTVAMDLTIAAMFSTLWAPAHKFNAVMVVEYRQQQPRDGAQ